MTIIIKAKEADDIIGLKEEIAACLEDIAEIERIEVEDDTDDH